MQVPKDFVRNYVIKMTLDPGVNASAMTPNQISKGALKLRAASHHKAKSSIEKEIKKMEYERKKIRNIIGNNPFRVKNYVAGDEINNNLIPRKLLRPKSNKYSNDEEFIENYLAEKRKEEEAEKRRQEKEAMMKKLKHSVAAKFKNMLKGGSSKSSILDSALNSQLTSQLTSQPSSPAKADELKNKLKLLIDTKMQDNK
jgi:hypothetical protein